MNAINTQARADISRMARYQASRLRGGLIEAGDLENEAVLAALRGRKSISGPMQDFIHKQSIVGTYHHSIKVPATRVPLDSISRVSVPSHEKRSIEKVSVEKLLSELTVRQKAALTLHYWFGITRTEMGNTFSNTRSQALARLRKIAVEKRL